MYTFTKRKNKPLFIPSTLKRILNALQEQGIRPVLVGGCVRDHFLNKNIKDYDIELFGCSDVEKIEHILEHFGHVKWVGKSFGVYKLNVQTHEFDFSLPRVEKKVALGYKGFDVQCDGMMDFKQACTRRDFTMNALGYDPATQTFLDPFHGLEDLHHHRLQHINDESFVQDPLRVYRAIGFCARFDLVCAPQTLKLCQNIVKSGEMQTLSTHRIFVEFKKILLKAKHPSLAFELMKTFGLFDIFCEFKLIEQSYILHSNQNLWKHTLRALNAMARMHIKNEKERLILMFAVIMHSFNAVQCLKQKQEIKQTVLNLLEKMCNDKSIIKEVERLQEFSFKRVHKSIEEQEYVAIALWANEITLYHLFLLLQAQNSAIEDVAVRQKHKKSIMKFLHFIKKEKIIHHPKKALIQGRDLIALGLKPSKEFSSVLQYAYITQLQHQKLQKEELLQRIKNKFNV